MVLWAVTLSGGLLVTMRWVAQSQGVRVPHAVWESGLRMGAFVAAMTLGVSAIGVLGSSLARLRRNAAAVVLLAVIFAWSGYGIVLAYYVDGVTNTSGPIWQLAALWPMTPIISLDGWSGMPKLWWTPSDAWLVCSVAYVVVALAALSLASGPADRGGGVREE